MYRVADPAFGKIKHHSNNQIPVETDEELLDHVRRGFHVRMRGVESGQINLIAPDEINRTAVESSSAHTEATLSREAPYSPIAVAMALPMATPTAPVMPTVGRLLPCHGRIDCRRCFGSREVTWGETTLDRGGWCIVNNPMAFGSQTPKILVLGFSKGGNQNADILRRPHDEVAFRGGRHNLSTILETLRLKSPDHSIDEMIADRDGEFAFGSLIRCSVKKWSGEKWLMSGKDIMGSCLRDGEMGEVITNCVSQFLGELPPSVRLVVMLGNETSYVDGCFSAIQLTLPNLHRLNAVSYADHTLTFVHSVHFKAQGAIVPNWSSGVPGRASRPETDQPLKRDLAIDAVVRAMK
jgi:hypothetical protein